MFQPCKKWKISIFGKPNQLIVGVAPENYAVNHLDSTDQETCAISAKGYHWYWPDCLNDVYSVPQIPQIPQMNWKCPKFEDDLSVVELTLKDGTLCINVNGKECDPVFENIPGEYIYPFASFSLDEYAAILIEKLE
jgi:hypothetical protein